MVIKVFESESEAQRLRHKISPACDELCGVSSWRIGDLECRLNESAILEIYAKIFPITLAIHQSANNYS
jgi:hypothetical protein